MKIYNLGSLNIDYVYAVDHFVTAGETLASESRSVFPGGKGLNQSVALAKAGAEVVHGAVVGDGSELLTDALTAAGVDTKRIEKRSGSGGHTFIQVDKHGQNCILLFPGTNHCVDKAYIEGFLSDAQAGDILLLQNEVSHLASAMEIAKAKGMRIAFNPSPFHKDILKLPLKSVTWWFCNEIESAALFGSGTPEEIGRAFLEQYPDSNLVLTLGEGGSIFISRDAWVRQPIYPVKAVDTTAAGDTFTGFFMAAWMEGKDVAFAMDLAAKAAAITVSRPGASSSIPTRDEVEG